MTSTTWCRRLLGAALIAAAALGGQAAAFADTAAAADARDRVVRDQFNGGANVLVPDRSEPGAAVRSVPRIGVADATPPAQTWRQENTRGGFALVHLPSLGGGRQPLCLDVQGAPVAGAALVLAACDGSDRQNWRLLTNSIFTQLENRQTGLKAEVVRGKLVQNEFPRRGDTDFRERGRLQLFSIVPKTFGVGGA